MGDPISKLTLLTRFVKKTWLPGGVAYFPYMCIVKLQTKSLPKWMVLFLSNFSGIILWWSLLEIAKRIEIHEELLFAMTSDWNLRKKSLKINHWSDFKIFLQKYLLSDPLTKLTFLTWFIKKHICQWVWLTQSGQVSDTVPSWPSCFFMFSKIKFFLKD